MATTLVPAYGRDYKSAKEVKQAWNDGKDFQVSDLFNPDDGRYVNVADAPKGQTWNIRYKKLQNIVVVKS